MKTYKVFWEVSKYAIVKAENEEKAIERVMNEEVEVWEDEITSPCEAIEYN